MKQGSEKQNTEADMQHTCISSLNCLQMWPDDNTEHILLIVCDLYKHLNCCVYVQILSVKFSKC